MIISHEHPEYIKAWQRLQGGQFNGAYYYSQEIVKNIIPHIKSDRNWITVNIKGLGIDHAIVFVHNNLHPENYEWLKQYKDIILVCGIPETVEKVKHIGKAIYLPLSVDLEYLNKFKVEKKTKKVGYFGRRSKAKGLPAGTEIISGIPRDELLKRMAKYEKAYAIGRCAIEALALGCELLPIPGETRFPDVSRWKVLDNSEAVKLLQKEIDKIDNPKKEKAASEKEKAPYDKPKKKRASRKKKVEDNA